MKLFYKLYFFLILLLIFLLSGFGYISYLRETSTFSNDMKKDAILIGKALSAMAEHAW